MKLRTFPTAIAFFLFVALPAFSGSGHNHGKKDEFGESHEKHTHENAATENNDHAHEDHKRHEHEKKKKKKKKGDYSHNHADEEGHNHGHEHKGEKSKGHDHDDEHEKDGDSHGHHDEVEKFGEGKAITAVVNEGESFSLSPKAEQTLGITYGTVKSVGVGLFQVPIQSLVEYQEKIGIYVKRNKWLTLVSVSIKRKDSDHYFVSSQSLTDNETIVIQKTGLVRVAHLEASGQGGQGHAH